MPIGSGRLDRAMQGLTIGVAKSVNDALKQKQLEQLQEVEEQFQVEVGGQAEEFPIWDSIDLKFDTRFIDATGQRPVPFDRPHMTYGSEVESQQPVGVFVHVNGWNVNDKGETVGCTLAVGVAATDLSTKFKGRVHVTFQGWGAAPESIYGNVN
jgi:hypothetical protein